MSWEDITGEYEEDGVAYPIETTMVCDFCGKKIEWYSAHRNYDEPDEETIQIAKDTDGWVNIGIHKYENDEERPCDIDVVAIMKHMCPDCCKKILKINENGEMI